MPPAFVLSQDQTLRKKNIKSRSHDQNPFSQRRFLTLLICTMYKFIVFLLRLFKFYSKLSKSDSGSSHDSIFQGTRRSNKKHAPQQKPNLFVRASVVRTYSPEKVFQNAFPPSAIFLSIPISREASQTILSFVMLPNLPSFFTLSNHFSKKIQKNSDCLRSFSPDPIQAICKSY